MMGDALRAAKVLPDFQSTLAVHLVEISPALRQLQQKTLEAFDVPMHWHKSLEEVPEGPSIILANEFFDALPVHQAIREDDGWHERAVIIDADGDFAIGPMRAPLGPMEKLLPPRVREAPVGDIFEWRADAPVLEIGRRIARNGGAALVIDYGHIQSEVGDTLQAVGEHTYANPLVAPGLVDLTAHVDFEALAVSAESIGARINGPVHQGDFLRRLGIATRAASLKANSPREKQNEIDGQLERLTGEGARRMGRLFKVIGIADRKLPPLPGFEA
jgi:SAM-dependent MidA family methyltransferase